MRKSGVAEKYVRVVQDMYERSRTVVRCAVGQTEEFKVEVGLHQGSALSPFMFAMVMDQLSEEVRQESPYTMMFADDIVICSESREQVEENLERWRFALERRGMKVSHKSEKMPEEWRSSVLVPIFKNKGDVQSCSNCRGIKLMSHTMKLWERVVEARLRKVAEICEQQYGFMPRKSTTDAIFALRMLMEKYRDGQRELHCVFVDLEKAYDRVPREELWYCMRKSGVAEKYVRVVQDMYERSRTVERCAVGQTEEFKVEVGLHQGSALSPFLFAMVMDQLSEEVREESPWTMMFADDIVICSESREQVEENLERWRRKEDKETWWWNEEVQDSIQRKRLAKKKWDMDRTEENRQEYKELQCRVKREVSKAKQEAYDELYTGLDTREGQNDLYRLVRQRDRDGKDVQQVRVIKDRDGRVLTSEESVQRRWKEYFEELMNEENEREKRVEEVTSVEQKVDKIRKDEVRKALKRM
ncbi:hypothetical protein PDJAM_G00049210 [Pangasius djambal]|uniref:Uncharacterized protein n=1 Tax=Pangasius djambal TaxID=1691987 RepID=A0ACC5YWB6_9TELE|nr:hypothetical protein [Pangasius djambal]